jgi:adenylylsulfate kinase-like enzyme
MTGLSGAGKTTIALIVEEQLKARGLNVERLDGDIVRQSLTRDLGFTKEDRDKNIERVTFVAKLLSRNNVGVIACFISPYQAVRDMVRGETTNFVEDPYEEPINPELVINTHQETPEESAARAIAYLEERGFIPAAETA